MKKFGFKKLLCRSVAMLLMLVCVFTVVPMEARAADDVDVFYGNDAANDNKRVSIQVASSSNLANCKTCVGRLRDAGYNAYIYQAEKKTTSYCIRIGAFASRQDAENFIEEIWAAPAVKGVKMDHAYLTNVYISDWGLSIYENPYYGGYYAPSTPTPTYTPSRPSTSDDVDVFYGNDAANDNKRVSIQVASSSNLANCKTCVGRLRDAGYNAYIYQAEKKTTSYCIRIGAFASRQDAENFIEEIWAAPAVKGVKMDHAYLTNVYISDWGLEIYEYPYY